MRRLVLTGALGGASAVALAVALALTPASPALAQPSQQEALERISAQLEQAAVIRATFTQTRQMAALKRPLVTTGRMAISRQHGVLWEIQKPYRMTYVLAEHQIVEIGPDGVRKERNVRDLPGLAQTSRMFRALLGANTAALIDVFQVNAQSQANAWQIDLTPRNAQMAQALRGLTVMGGRFVDSIRIDEAGGDSTLIRIHAAKSDTALSDDELRLFVPAPSGPAKP